MINLDKQTNSILRNLYFNKEYQSLVLLADALRRDLRNTSVDKSSEWDVVKDALSREYQVEGIKLFLKAIKDTADKEQELIKGKNE